MFSKEEVDMRVANKRILVVGMARSGIAAAKLLCKAGATPILNDSKEEAAFGDALDFAVPWYCPGCIAPARHTPA